MKTKLVLVSAAIAFASSVFAQKAELFGDYTYMQFNPTISGLQSRALNGGGAGFQFNFGGILVIKGEFQGYTSTQNSFTVKSPIGTSQGIIPIGTYTSAGNMFTYLFGPVVRVPSKKVSVFGEILFGGSNTTLYTDLTNTVIANGGKLSASATQHPFTMALGGGLDVNLNKRVALRLGEVDWVLTRYTNIFTNTNNQNSFRYLGGIVLKFGEQ